jgi:hypothetical protein
MVYQDAQHLAQSKSLLWLQSDRKYASSGRCCALPLTLTTTAFFFLWFLFLIFGFGYNSITKVSFSTKSYQGYGGSILKRRKIRKITRRAQTTLCFGGLLCLFYISTIPRQQGLMDGRMHDWIWFLPSMFFTFLLSRRTGRKYTESGWWGRGKDLKAKFGYHDGLKQQLDIADARNQQLTWYLVPILGYDDTLRSPIPTLWVTWVKCPKSIVILSSTQAGIVLYTIKDITVKWATN